MSSINPQITAATAGDRRRAAEFNRIRTMGPQETPGALLGRASVNLGRARLEWARSLTVRDLTLVRRDLHDARNLIALALSVMPEEQL
jgi:hypothetical protein